VHLDRFRGTSQRWIIETGPLANTQYDYAFHDDWSLTWQVRAGELQGQVGRARHFLMQPVRAQLFLISFQAMPHLMVAVTVDFASRQIVGFHGGLRHCPLTGTFFML
jgi:hypothetical protein